MDQLAFSLMERAIERAIGNPMDPPRKGWPLAVGPGSVSVMMPAPGSRYVRSPVSVMMPTPGKRYVRMAQAAVSAISGLI
jgi:hypothetical protein